MLVNTKAAARAVGLSEYELRIGFKRGDYPALEIGRGDRRRSLRWDVAKLEACLAARMEARLTPDAGR